MRVNPSFVVMTVTIQLSLSKNIGSCFILNQTVTSYLLLIGFQVGVFQPALLYLH